MCVEKDDHNRWVKLNSEFHNQIYSRIRKGILYEMIMTLRNRTGHYGRTYTKLLNRTETATSEHEQLLDAILKRDRAKANRITQKHLRGLGRTLKPYLQEKRTSKETIREKA
jgi:DNA-binding GntR family transcriptional regulator